MDISIMECKIYVISPGKGKYRDRLMTSFRRLVDMGFHHVEFVRSVPDDSSTTNSLTRTVMLIFEKELHETRPFIIVEDDVQVFQIQRTIHVPMDAHLVYLGVAWWLYPFPPSSLFHKDRQKSFHICPMRKQLVGSLDDDLVSVSGMMSAHAILFLNRSFLRAFLDKMKDLLPNNTPHDLLLASMHHEWNALALKQPLFYQDATLGGQEDVTKLWWDDELERYSRCSS